MILKQFVTGLLEVNNYLLIDETSKEAVLIDCSEYNHDILLELKKHNATLKYILLTHGHFDHILGVNEFKSHLDCKVLINKEDTELTENIDKYMSGFGFGPMPAQKVDEYIEDNEIIKFGEHEIKVIHTPGHTRGGVCYLIEDCLFSGDTIFKEAVGRTDLYGGNFATLKQSIEEKIFTLDDKIKIYPGHGRSTTVAYEKENNKFL